MDLNRKIISITKGSHNHYGNSDKSLYPNEPDYIEDSSKHRNDNAYTGPGH